MQEAMKTTSKTHNNKSYRGIYDRMTGRKKGGRRIELDGNDLQTKHTNEIDKHEPDYAAMIVIETADILKPEGIKQVTYINWQNHEDRALKTLQSALQKVHNSKASSHEKHIMNKFITKKYMNNRQMERIKSQNAEHVKEIQINACHICGEVNGDEWAHIMFRCPATIWLSEVITMMCKYISNTKVKKGKAHIDSRDGIPADLKLLHYIETTNEYKIHDKETPGHAPGLTIRQTETKTELKTGTKTDNRKTTRTPPI